MTDDLRRDQVIAFAVAEKDAESRRAGPIQPVDWPDVTERRRPAVELLGSDGFKLVAVEHTVIESYPEQTTESKALEALFPMGGPELPEVPDAGHYRLLLRPGSAAMVRWCDREGVATAVRDWVRQNLPRVPWPHVAGSPTFISGRVDRVPFDLDLERWIDSVGFVGPLARVVRASYWRPLDLEERRVERLRRTLLRKVPKLLAACGDEGRSVLVLEDRDMHMSAPAFVSRALKKASDGVALPDVTYLFTQTGGNPLVQRIQEGYTWWHDGYGSGWMTFSDAWSDKLNALTP